MKKRLRGFSLALVLVFVFSLTLAACGKTSEDSNGGTPAVSQTESGASPAASTEESAAPSGPDISKEAKIVMYLIGDEQPDAPKVYEEVNKKLKADINATVQCKYLPWADWTQKYPLVFASGEEFDLIYTADWVMYADQATKNGFMEITQDMLSTNMPEYFNLIPDGFWDQLKINGKVFMVPYLNKQVIGHQVIMSRGDLREKYGLEPINSIGNMEKYMLAIAENEKGMMAYEGGAAGIVSLLNGNYYKQPNDLMFLHVSPNLFTTSLKAGADGKIGYALDDPKYIEAIKRIRKLYEAGCWSKNLLAIKTEANENFKAGKAGIMTIHSEQAIQYSGENNTLHPEYKTEISDINADNIHESNSATRSGMGISANSKNWQRALMMMNLFGTRKDYYDLTTYGIEGVHYEPVGDNKMKVLPAGASNFPAKTNCPWGWERKDFMRYADVVPDEVIGLEKAWIDSGKASTSPVVSFNFVDTNVKNEIAACTNIYNIRGTALLSGMLPNVDDEVAKLKDDLKKAGVEKIQAELQKQMDEYLKQFN
jgi:putative aldouronate transport system substrate-binding protein